MRKIFIAIIVIFTCIFLYWGAKTLINYGNDLQIFMNDSVINSSTSGSFGFKQTPENLELVNSYLKVNTSFINELSKEIAEKNSINNINSLIKGFPNFKNYYSAKLKLEKAIFEELPSLIENASSLSETELKNFFENNKEYLETTFGINQLEQFNAIIMDLRYLQNKEIKYAEIPKNSAIYNPYGGNTIFNLNVGSTSDDYISFSITAYHGFDTPTQKAPVIVFYGLGGMS